MEPQRRADRDAPGEANHRSACRQARGCRCSWAASATTWLPSGEPEPAGWNVSGWRRSASRCRASAGRASAGRARARRRPAREKVSSIGVDGSIVVPGAGLTSASSRVPGREPADARPVPRAAPRAARPPTTVSVPKRFGPVACDAGLDDLARLREDELLLAEAGQLQDSDARRRRGSGARRGRRAAGGGACADVGAWA